jgi:hypothetical protein
VCDLGDGFEFVSSGTPGVWSTSSPGPEHADLTFTVAFATHVRFTRPQATLRLIGDCQLASR